MMKTQHELIILEGFFSQAAVTFSAEIFIEMSYWPKTIEMSGLTCRDDLGAPELEDCSKKKDQGQKE